MRNPLFSCVLVWLSAAAVLGESCAADRGDADYTGINLTIEYQADLNLDSLRLRGATEDGTSYQKIILLPPATTGLQIQTVVILLDDSLHNMNFVLRIEGLRESVAVASGTLDVVLQAGQLLNRGVSLVAHATCQQNGDCDDHNECTQDECVGSVCGYSLEMDGTSCDDGLYCTTPDACLMGSCQGQTRDCDDGLACTEDSCGEEQARCLHRFQPTGEPEGEPGSAACQNGLDDDCDGLTDGLDEDCGEEHLVYRSVGPGNTMPLATGLGNALVLNGTVAVFTNALPARIGVGDALAYDQNADGQRDTLAFVHARVDATHLEVRDADGSGPVPTAAGDENWRIWRAYTSLDGALAGHENPGIDDALEDFDTFDSTRGKDLVASDQSWHIACYADGPDSQVAWAGSGWKTDPTHVLRIFTPRDSAQVGISQRHSGRWNDAAYRMTSSPGQDFASQLGIEAGHVIVEGLQFELTAYHEGNSSLYCGDTRGVFRMSHNLFRGGASLTDGATGLNVWRVGSGEIHVFNNIFYGFRRSEYGSQYGLMISDSDADGYVYHNTVYDCEVGIAGDLSKVAVINNIANDCDEAYENWQDGDHPDSDYNRCDNPEDWQAFPGTHSVCGPAGQVNFTSAHMVDLHLDAADTAAKNQGLDLSSHPTLSISDDIDGDPRPQGSAWDIGADECSD